MGHWKTGKPARSQTLPSSPTHSSSSSDFEFTVSLSPRKSSATNLCPADDLFYKGQLLPLHLSPRISMVRTLLLSFSSSSTSSSSATTARHSSDSHLGLFKKPETKLLSTTITATTQSRVDPDIVTGSSVKRMIQKYLKKAKPLYEKLSQKTPPKTEGVRKENDVVSHSFSGNLRYPRRRSCVSSCPSSMRSSPSHSGILCRNGVVRGTGGGIYSSSSSSMDELQSAIQGEIAHCKNSMTQGK
ncbi:hypothetical protein L1987_15221 [Smallanthus sonchifolius]|uniref:Uncharacterized protein n=1 Tax=Smallanthus sonchifolius TaxID=185202 RepID=A0ACB9J5G7_9ASTR|nr:hypothetical protein L1987_15221 [Smallanthus sonchifolius]